MRILIVKLSSMGDVLHALPVLSDIKKNCGQDTQIDWISEPHYVHFLKDHPLIHKIHELPLRKYHFFLKSIQSPEAKGLKHFLKHHPYDVIIDLQGLLKSAWVTRWAKGKSFGYDAKSIREPLASFFYQQTLSVSKDLHAVSRMRQLAAHALGYAVPMDEPNYAFNTHPINTKIDVTKKLKLIVFPFTTWPSKHWPAEHWQTFLKLAENYFTVVIAWGSKEEYQQAQSFCKDLKGCELAPTLSIESMKGFLSHCDAFVGVDTGFSHLATALMIPGIVLMGPTDKKKSGPLGCQQIALDVDLPCRACHKRICPLPQDQTMNPKRLGTTKTLGTKYLAPKCLVLISPEFVLQQLQRLIKT